MVEFDDAEAMRTDRIYRTPDVTRQRMRTLEALHLRTGEHVLDVGCGSGLLTEDMASLVGEGGRVVGVDTSLAMLALAERRCAGLAQIDLKQAGVEDLPEESDSFDAAACVQVLLYADVPTALSEIKRVLKRGGRIAILETDWRGTVLNSFDDALTRKVLAAWDAAVPSPNLPALLGPLLKAASFTAIAVHAFPIVNTDCSPGNFSAEMFEQFAGCAQEQGTVSAKEARAWLADLRRRGGEGSYFFCVNRFIFSAVKA